MNGRPVSRILECRFLLDGSAIQEGLRLGGGELLVPYPHGRLVRLDNASARTLAARLPQVDRIETRPVQGAVHLILAEFRHPYPACNP